MIKNECILSLDMSTTCTGWAVFKDENLEDYGKIIPNKDKEWQLRLQETAAEIKSIIIKYQPYKIIAEDVPLKEKRRNENSSYVRSYTRSVAGNLWSL